MVGLVVLGFIVFLTFLKSFSVGKLCEGPQVAKKSGVDVWDVG